MNTLSVSEIQRNLHKLDDFDIIEVLDKKRNTTKGYFLDKKYQSLIESLVQSKENELEAFKKASQNVSKIDCDIDLLKIGEEINSDIS